MVQDHPLSLRFDFEDKGFYVEGAYDIRYEIMKKRIDKATIRGTADRLTQPDTISIVYSGQHERDEYFKHLKYLMDIGMLEGEIEQFELNDMQGIQGLRALRININLSYQKSLKSAAWW